MTKFSTILFRILGAAYVAFAFWLLPLSMLIGFFSVLVILPALIWLVIIGFWLWRRDRRARGALRYTHVVLASIAIALVVYGIFALYAAQRSAEAGGGLFGAFGLIPIAWGLLAGSLSIVSLCVSYSSALKNTTCTEQSLRSDSD